ncbi:MAG: tRNA pseudouridine(55) synthase TruB [Gemmatimonadaceae bacterium]
MPATGTSGFLLIDKPSGMTSHDAVALVRRALGDSRVGHTGTLDPFAAGLLLMLVGRATRLAAYVSDEPKVYDATIRFGSETDTDDTTGRAVRAAEPPDREAIDAAVAQLTGEITQEPPQYSAKQVDGRRAYKLARRKIAVPLRPVSVHVAGWDILERTRDSCRARITCSGGTYIRALARDLGRLTRSAAHCSALRRLAAGPFHVNDALPPDGVRPGDVRPPLAAVPGLPTERLDKETALGAAHGRSTPATVAGTWAALVNDSDVLVAIAERADGRWQPRVVLSEP